MSLKAKQELTSNLYAKSAQARADFLCFTPDPTNLISPPSSENGATDGDRTRDTQIHNLVL